MSDTRDEAGDALAAFTRSARWAWGGAALHLGYRSIRGPDDEYWAVCVAQGRLVFAARLGVVGDFSRSERVGSISPRREDVVIVDEGLALLTEEEEHTKGSVHPAILVLARDGAVRGRVAGRVDEAEAPRREGGALRVRRRADHWHPEPVVYVDLTGGRPEGVDAVHAAAEAGGYVDVSPLHLDGQCLAKRAREGASASPPSPPPAPHCPGSARSQTIAGAAAREAVPHRGPFGVRG